MKIFNEWRGPSDTYLSPNAPGQDIITAATTSRWMPFRDKSMAHAIMSPGARNLSGQSLGQVHEGVETADEKARRANFAFSA